jgi:dTDP-glucose 4,6-dehydratase
MRIFESDLKQITEQATPDLVALRRSHIFLTGGTGYIGRWLLEALCYANTVLKLELKLTVLSRAPDQFRNKYPYLSDKLVVNFIEGDIRTFQFPQGVFTHVIHAATDVIATNPALETFDVIVSGTKRLLDFCREKRVEHVLLLSSGAIYGPIPATIDLVVEDYSGAPRASDLGAAYGIGKLAAEWLGTAYSADRSMTCKAARVFAQIGPHLALDKQFAAGNFLLHAIKQEPFLIKGDGTTLRSYMYGTDLAVWLLRILVQGEAGRAYNVGSSDAISIYELAKLTAEVAGIVTPMIQIKGKPLLNKPPERYIPDISRARDELALDVRVDLRDALSRTLDWFRVHHR